MKRTTIGLPDDVHMALRRAALDQHITMVELIRRISALYLRSNRLFWRTVDRLREPSAECDPDLAERAILSATREFRGKKRSAPKRQPRKGFTTTSESKR